jgi:hypothetical protein
MTWTNNQVIPIQIAGWNLDKPSQHPDKPRHTKAFTMYNTTDTALLLGISKSTFKVFLQKWKSESSRTALGESQGEGRATYYSDHDVAIVRANYFEIMKTRLPKSQTFHETAVSESLAVLPSVHNVSVEVLIPQPVRSFKDFSGHSDTLVDNIQQAVNMSNEHTAIENDAIFQARLAKIKDEARIKAAQIVQMESLVLDQEIRNARAEQAKKLGLV